MKILLVTRNLPPLLGGMERLNWHMADELTKYAEVTIVGPEEALDQKPDKTVLVGVPLKPLWKFLLSAGCQAIKIARQWKPDVIIAGSGLTAPLVLIAARLSGAKAVCYVHGLDVAVRHPIYKAVWLPAIKHLNRVIANSSATAALVKNLKMDQAKIGIVYPGVTLPNINADENAIQQFHAKHDLGNRQLLLSVGRLTTRKGLREFVKFALPEIVKEYPDVLLTVVGDAPKDSLYAEAQTPESILEEAQLAGVRDNIKFLGVITDREVLSAAYWSASVHVFPVKYLPGDPEGFGMVAIEAAAHGLPTVAFASGGIVDAVKHESSGFLVAPDNYDELTKRILSLLKQELSFNQSCLEFAHSFSWENFGSHIIENIVEKEDN